ncbi:9937_t:CDS:10 [Funneliformis geosporum]|nr:9937_t:CDS:10 [Funneliformis geosporum]
MWSNDEGNTDLDSIICGMYFSAYDQVICIAFHNGDIVIVHSSQQAELVGSIESKIQSMEWSPDEELVTFVTGNDTILVMTKDFDVITEFPINVDEAGEAVSISVGWGKKETQFHGSVGKSAAQNKVDVSGFTLSPDDDLKPRISWIGDGSMFCCSIIDPNKGLRVIRVYNREGLLQYTSEPVDKLEHVLSWRPSGNLITSSQKLADKHEIIFFEKNGLRHGEFMLRETFAHKIIEIVWNCDSSVLAIWMEKNISDNEHSTCVQLWNMNNYHWYLKQEIQSQSDVRITSVSWDPEKALRLHYTTTNEYHCLDFCWEVFSANTISDQNAASIAVIDGTLATVKNSLNHQNLMFHLINVSVNLTPFRVMNVPPPMFAFSVQLSNPASCVTFSPNNGGNDFAVLESNQQITLFEWSGALERPIKAPTIIESIQIEDPNHDRRIMRQIIWFNRSVIFFLHSSKELNHYDNLVAIYLTYDENGKAKCVSYENFNLKQNVLKLNFNPNNKELWFESIHGKIFKVEIYMDRIEKFIENINYKEEKIKIQDDVFIQFPEVCHWISSTRIGRERTENVIIGLSENNKLYGNHMLISAECTSFFVHNTLLLFTTLSNVIKFLPLQANLSVERGSKIICAVYFDVFLLLQMPRGNLETVHPRVLVLASVRESLDRFDYLSAYMTCRKHRIDLNILYDHDPKSFLNNVELFVNQVEKVEYLNLFLSSLRMQDVSTKVNSVCDAVRGILESKNSTKYLQSIITTFVKKSPPELESALSYLAKLKDINIAEDAVKYAIFLVDADKLFDIALGMYDFSLVLLVAQQSQKYYQRFKIDHHLNRYEKALNNLSLAGDEYFDQCLKYLQEHQLYKPAISLFANNNEKYKKVMVIYGDYLISESNFKEAGLGTRVEFS